MEFKTVKLLFFYIGGERARGCEGAHARTGTHEQVRERRLNFNPTNQDGRTTDDGRNDGLRLIGGPYHFYPLITEWYPDGIGMVHGWYHREL